MSITGVSEVRLVVQKFLTQEETNKQLKDLTEELQVCTLKDENVKALAKFGGGLSKSRK